MKERVFISYKRVDQTRVFDVKDNIESVIKESCWIDQKGIPSDAKWENEIKKAIDICAVFIFVLSEAHNRIENLEEDWCYREISYASQQGKHIEIIKIDDMHLPEWIDKFIPGIDVIHTNDSKNLKILYSNLSKWLGVANANKVKAMPEGKFQVNDLYYQSLESRLCVKVAKVPNQYDAYVIDIPSSIEVNGYEYEVVCIGKDAFSQNKEIKRIVLPDSVTYIDAGAFKGCSSLYSINIPDNVYHIGEEAFMDCSSLKSINIPSMVTHIEKCTFCGCTALSTIIIPENVKKIGDAAFAKCYSIESITFPTELSIIEDSAFSGCASLKSLIIPSKVRIIGSYAFSECSKLTSINIPASVESIDNSFYECISLRSIVVESENKNYDSRDNCNALIETSTNKLLTGTINSVIPKGVTTIEDYAFSKLPIIHIDIPEGVTKINDYALSGCENLLSVTFPSTLEHIGYHAFSECTSLLSVDIPEGVTSIDFSAFSFCKSLLSVSLPKSLENILLHAFSGCKSLINIIIPRGTKARFQEMEGLKEFKCLLKEDD